ncbi:hypothetical protein QBC33DRAFT_511253 [Phialemonium atrogriseum]|uniref:Uncharacterized protein n=1 Tax=Phialemonium atrogriseum TaxID=1093897 RepID=A0AAJ0C7U6_9PEZI|nr:uncharacterized protein QBC33DRAFT_511253 [Phialemonium atrogriseum]KAK1771759.1 hypothetical protein QBC33DRAFT_511253 [Phialemonium atrogriseum]
MHSLRNYNASASEHFIGSAQGSLANLYRFSQSLSEDTAPTPRMVHVYSWSAMPSRLASRSIAFNSWNVAGSQAIANSSSAGAPTAANSRATADSPTLTSSTAPDQPKDAVLSRSGQSKDAVRSRLGRSKDTSRPVPVLQQPKAKITCSSPDRPSQPGLEAAGAPPARRIVKIYLKPKDAARSKSSISSGPSSATALEPPSTPQRLRAVQRSKVPVTPEAPVAPKVQVTPEAIVAPMFPVTPKAPVAPKVQVTYSPRLVATAHLRYRSPETHLLYPKHVESPPTSQIELWKALAKLSWDQQIRGRVDATPSPAPRTPETRAPATPSVTADIGSNLLDGSIPMYLLAAGIERKIQGDKTPSSARPPTPSHLHGGVTDYAMTPPRIWWQEDSHPSPSRHRKRYLKDDTTDEYDESRSIASGSTQTWASPVGANAVLQAMKREKEEQDRKILAMAAKIIAEGNAKLKRPIKAGADILAKYLPADTPANDPQVAPPAPIAGSPVQASPVQASPVQASPVQAPSVQVSPVQALPVQASPVPRPSSPDNLSNSDGSDGSFGLPPKAHWIDGQPFWVDSNGICVLAPADFKYLEGKPWVPPTVACRSVPAALCTMAFAPMVPSQAPATGFSHFAFARQVSAESLLSENQPRFLSTSIGKQVLPVPRPQPVSEIQGPFQYGLRLDVARGLVATSGKAGVVTK